VRAVGFIINTANLSPEERVGYLAQLEEEFRLPAVDPLATGVAAIVDRLA
jgi:uncharacterized NAD-dependent epimerase/dehydratase family protein